MSYYILFTLQITRTVFEKCGEPRLVKRSALHTSADSSTPTSSNSVRHIIFGNGQDFRFEEGLEKSSNSELITAEKKRYIRRSGSQHFNQRPFTNKKGTRSWNVARPRKQIDKSQFEAVIHDIRQTVRRSQGFWRHLPYALCASSQETLFSRVLR